jgi:NAD(P)-dependent dehydrogenase (short-subunit alcohol dehydrogenase family)
MNKKAVVTGASLGIGRATVELLLESGWQVWGLDLDHPKVLPGSSAYRHRICDISCPHSIAVAFQQIRAETDGIDALVCNAGVTLIGELQTIELDDVDKMYQVNLRGHWLTIRAATGLLQHGASVEDPSRVVIVGSIAGIRPKVGNGFYSAFKQALHTISGIYAVELAPLGITVNTVAPGTVDTRMSREAAQKAAVESGSRFRVSGPSPLGRIASPGDVANAIKFFLEDGSRYINGTVLPVDGGTRAAFIGPTSSAPAT